jgi:probable phosphomutase (TIGR03848 family)
MAVFLFIRHGQNDMVGQKLAGRLPGVHLNADGKAQARQLAADLAALPVVKVYASPLARAQETAEPIARVHNLVVESCQALLEIDYGQWQGKQLRRLRRHKLWQVVQDDPEKMCFPGGESFLEAQARIVNGVEMLKGRHAEKDMVVCVAHSDVIRLVVAHYLGLPLKTFQRLRIAPASVTMLNLLGETISFDAINHTSHRFL